MDQSNPMDTCMYCGSNNIKKEVSVGTGNYKTGLKHGTYLPAVEWFYADLCKDCGSVRLYVKDTNKNWT